MKKIMFFTFVLCANIVNGANPQLYQVQLPADASVRVTLAHQALNGNGVVATPEIYHAKLLRAHALIKYGQHTGLISQFNKKDYPFMLEILTTQLLQSNSWGLYNNEYLDLATLTCLHPFYVENQLAHNIFPFDGHDIQPIAPMALNFNNAGPIEPLFGQLHIAG